MPEIVIPAAVVLACVTVSVDPPLFDMVTDCEPVPPTGTEPKSMEAGATEIVAAPPVVCPFKEVLDPTAIPVQPENDRNVKRIRISAAKEIGFLCASRKRAWIAYFSAPANTSFLAKLFIFKDCGLQLAKKLLTLGTFKGQGSAPAPGTPLWRG